jgi:hypothetical protein
METENKYQRKQRLKEERKQAKIEKRLERKRRKFEKISNSKVKKSHTFLYKFLTRVVPVTSILYLGFKISQYMISTDRPEPLNIHFNIFKWDVFNWYINMDYIFIVLFALLAVIISLGIITLGYLSNGSKSTKIANNIGKASKTYSPTLIKIIKYTLLGTFFGILWLLPIITDLYGKVILDIVYLSFYCYLVGAGSSIVGEFLYQRILNKVEKDQHEAKHITEMNTYDIANKLDE